MTLRIKSTADLKMLSKNAQQQIKEKAPHLLKAAKKQSRVFKTVEGLNYCIYPSSDPAVWLHNALVNIYGSMSLSKEGEIAHEVSIAQSDKNYRFDHIHIPTRTAIEFDGWKNHSNLGAFKRDRDKDKVALINGFIVFRITNSEVRHSLSIKLDELTKLITTRTRWLDKIQQRGRSYFVVIAGEQVINERK